MVQYWLYKLGEFVVNRLSLSQNYRIARFISDIQFNCSRVDRKAVVRNLTIILGDEQAAKVRAREMFRYFGMYLVDFMRMARHKEEYLQRVRVQGEEHVREAMASDKGVIVLTAHIGNWELGSAVISHYFERPLVVALPHQDRKVDAWFNAQREAVGVDVVPTTIALRKCLEALQKKRFVAMAADRDFGMHGEMMDFLKRKAMFPKGPAVFSLKTGAPIVPTFLHRNDDASFTVTFSKPIYPQAADPKKITLDEIRSLMQQYVTVIQQKIYEQPTQWLMYREYAVG